MIVVLKMKRCPAGCLQKWMVHEVAYCDSYESADEWCLNNPLERWDGWLYKYEERR